MKYCANCGNSIDDKADYCIFCGFKQNPNPVKKQEEEPGFFLKIFCLLVPVLGFAMYFYYDDEKPKCAKTCLTLAVINIIIDTIITLLAAFLPLVLKVLQIKSYLGG